MREAEDGTVSSLEDEEKKRASLTANTELNFVSPSTLKLLRAKKVDFYFLPLYSKCEMKQRSFPHQSLIATFKSSRWQAAVRKARMTTICPSRRKAWPLWRLLMRAVHRQSRNRLRLSQYNLILPRYRQRLLTFSRSPRAPYPQNVPQMRPSHKLIFRISLSDSQRKKGSTGQIRLVRCLPPEVTSDKRSMPARSRTLDYSWKSCESGAVYQSVVFLFHIPALQTTLCLPGC